MGFSYLLISVFDFFGLIYGGEFDLSWRGRKIDYFIKIKKFEGLGLGLGLEIVRNIDKEYSSYAKIYQTLREDLMGYLTILIHLDQV